MGNPIVCPAAAVLLTPAAIRMCRIERMLRRGPVPPSQMIEHVAGWRATIKRDLVALRLDFGADIAYDKTANVYVLRNSEWQGVRARLSDELRFI